MHPGSAGPAELRNVLRTGEGPPWFCHDGGPRGQTKRNWVRDGRPCPRVPPNGHHAPSYVTREENRREDAMSALSGTWTVTATPKKRWTVGTPFAGFSPTGTRQTPRQNCGGPTCRLQSHRNERHPATQSVAVAARSGRWGRCGTGFIADRWLLRRSVARGFPWPLGQGYYTRNTTGDPLLIFFF